MATDDPGMPSGGPVRTTDLGEVTLDQLEEVLRETLPKLDGAGIAYAVIGGLAVTTLARPRWTHDIDVFLRPRDAARALEVLGGDGYEIERFDHEWLFKAWRGEVMIDLIFRSAGNLYFDDEVEERRVQRQFLGVSMPVVSPEDLLVMKAAADTELNHYHWFDAIGILANHELDWAYVLRRARSSQRHLLSLLVYADALDCHVPRQVVRRLSERLYGGASDAPDRPWMDGANLDVAAPDQRSQLEEQLRQRLRHHPAIGDLDIAVRLEDGAVVVTGEVETEQRQRDVARWASEILVDWPVTNEVSVRAVEGQPHVEVVS